MVEKKVILSGMRPTGRLHIGHIESVLRNWLKLQEEYKCYYFIADWHALTTEPDTKKIKENSIEMIKDWLAFGIDPDKSTIFLQSNVPEHAELHLALSMLTNIGRLERVPSFKAQLSHLAKGDAEKEESIRGTISYGFMGYPVLQAADILLYKTDFVPVGEDQVPHIELTREIARAFNNFYGEVFNIPEVKLSQVPRILGTDGRKMSKSYDNTISPEDPRETIDAKVRMMVTDPARKRRADPGNPDVCSVYDLHLLYRQDESIGIYKKCISAGIGCTECKGLLAAPISETYQEFKEKRDSILEDQIIEIIKQGSRNARKVAAETMRQVKHMMMIDYI